MESATLVIATLLFAFIKASTAGDADLEGHERPSDHVHTGIIPTELLKERPQILLPEYLLTPVGQPLAASELPPEIQPDKDVDISEKARAAHLHELYPIHQRLPPGVPPMVDDPTASFVFANPAESEEFFESIKKKPTNTKNQGHKEENQSDVVLELNPEAEDLEFRHENSTYKQLKPMPNFTAKIYTLSYGGQRKPVLIVQPDMRQANNNNDQGSKGSQTAAPEETSIPNFSIHFPLQSNSQFQIPRFNFTLPTLFLPGLVFTQNENLEKNTHEIHVSFPQTADTTPYDSFPTSHVQPADLELLLQPPNNNENNHGFQPFPFNGGAPTEAVEPMPEKYDENHAEVEAPKPYVPEPRDPVPQSATTVITNGNNRVDNFKPPGFTPLSGLEGLSHIHKGAMGSFHNSIHPHNQHSSISQQPAEISMATPYKVTNKEPSQQYHGYPQQVEAMAPASAGNKPTEEEKIVVVQAGTHGSLDSVPLSQLRPLNAIQSLLTTPLNSLRPNISITHPQWNLPSISDIYNRLFGSYRNGEDCLARFGDTDTDDDEETLDNDQNLCGSEGLCGVTCHRLGFFLGKCVDELSCVCLLKNRPEFGLKLEYYVDKRARSWEHAFPAFGLCHVAACRLNCERSGYLTGVCDNTCLCGSPWAEKMRK